MAVHFEPAEGEQSSSATPIPEATFGSKRFRVLRRLGSGGFGVVYLAHDLETATDVASRPSPPRGPS